MEARSWYLLVFLITAALSAAACSFDPDTMIGTWELSEEISDCHSKEYLRFQDDGLVFYMDDKGNYAHGVFTISKGRFYPVQLTIKGTWAQNYGKCGWKENGYIDNYIQTFDDDSWCFFNSTEQKWRRLERPAFLKRDIPKTQ